MITEQAVRQIVAEKIEADGGFIVEVSVGTNNAIRLVVDRKGGVPISYCIELTRMIEASLDRDVEDYELEVSSAGIGCIFKVKEQYEKNIGNEVEVTLSNGRRQKGILTEVSPEHFTVECEEKESVEGSKKKVTVQKSYQYDYKEVKQVKDIISFKR